MRAARMAAALAALAALAAVRHAAALPMCAVPLQVAAGASVCAAGWFQYIKTSTYPRAPAPCTQRGSVSGAMRALFPPINGSCDFAARALITRDKPLAASLAQAYVDTPTPLNVDTIGGSFTTTVGGLYTVAWSLEGLKVSVSTDALGLKLNAKRTVSSATALVTAGDYKANFRVDRGPGLQWNCTFEAPVDGEESLPAKGCSLTLRATTREWLLNCATATFDIPKFEYVVASGDTVAVDIAITARGLTFSGAMSAAQLVDV